MYLTKIIMGLNAYIYSARSYSHTGLHCHSEVLYVIPKLQLKEGAQYVCYFYLTEALIVVDRATASHPPASYQIYLLIFLTLTHTTVGASKE